MPFVLVSTKSGIAAPPHMICVPDDAVLLRCSKKMMGRHLLYDGDGCGKSGNNALSVEVFSAAMKNVSNTTSTPPGPTCTISNACLISSVREPPTSKPIKSFINIIGAYFCPSSRIVFARRNPGSALGRKAFTRRSQSPLPDHSHALYPLKPPSAACAHHILFPRSQQSQSTPPNRDCHPQSQAYPSQTFPPQSTTRAAIFIF